MMTYQLIVDDAAVDVKQLTLKDQVVKDSVCRFYSGLLTGWTAGQRSYIWTHTIRQELSDGWDIYPAGVYRLKFTVNIR